MKALIVGFLLALSSVVGADTSEAPLTDEKTFEYACAYVEFMYGVSCDGIDAPYLITSRVVSSDYYGFYYPGEPYVYINKRLWLHDRAEWYTTAVHESTHYILNEAGYEVTRCESEEIARRVHHSWNKTKYDDSWRDMYRC